jgi:aminopeptidase N
MLQTFGQNLFARGATPRRPTKQPAFGQNDQGRAPASLDLFLGRRRAIGVDYRHHIGRLTDVRSWGTVIVRLARRRWCRNDGGSMDVPTYRAARGAVIAVVVGVIVAAPAATATSKRLDSMKTIVRTGMDTRGRLRTLALALMLGLVGAAPASAAGPSAGAAGLGDRLNPGIGNGGYDVQSYDLHLRYATADPGQALQGDETIVARATQALSRFNLDFAGKSIGAVSVNGHAAAFKRTGEELIVTPAGPIDNGSTFTVRITAFTATPTKITKAIHSTTFFVTPDGSATAPQPYDAHLIYPCNDHPSDKATFTFTIDVPAGRDAVANGVETGHTTSNGRTIWTYRMAQPMATELTQIAVGDWDFGPTYDHGGVTVRDATAPAITADVQPALALTGAQLDWMTARVGSYPFDSYGLLIVDAPLPLQLETQSITLSRADFFSGYPRAIWEPGMVHELAHMWFGDSVSPSSWSDLWLNEGYATWYEFTYAEEAGQLAGDTEGYPDPQGYATLDDLMRAMYAHGDEWRKKSGPVAMPKSGDVLKLYSFQVFHGGALVLYALRQKIGASGFEEVARAWVERYRGRSASTDDFVALATEVSADQSVAPFLRDWLYGKKTPPMPGHPDWTVNPVGSITTSSTEPVAGHRAWQP